MKFHFPLKPILCLLLPLSALLAQSGCGGDEASESQEKSTQEKSTQEKSTQEKSTQAESPKPKNQAPVNSKPEKKLPVTVVGKWKDKNKLSFDEDVAKGTVSTSGTITFKANEKWESKGLVTLNGSLIGRKADNLKFQQESSGSWERKGKEILRTWSKLKLTPKAPSLGALAIQNLAPSLVKGKKEKYEIISLDRERMVLRKTETGDEVTLIRME